MGYLFESKDKTVWSPSMDVGRCFLSQVRHIEERLEIASGLGEVISDFIEIDFEGVSRFLQQIGIWANLENRSMQLLSKGVIVHLLALLSCSALPKQIEGLYPCDWVQEAKSLSRFNMQSIRADEH